MSTARHPLAAAPVQIALPLVLLSIVSFGILHQTGVFEAAPSSAVLYEPQVISIAPRTFKYRADGEFYRGAHQVDAPLETVIQTQPLTIMKYQVTMAEYDACVSESVCAPTEATPVLNVTLPITGVSYDDAMTYARWLSKKTGAYWTVPTDQQLAFAAGKAFPDDASGIDPDNKNPALRWIADYEREAALRSNRNPAPRPIGSFGENEHGLADFAGNVWEWTSTCHRKVHLYENGSQRSAESLCGVNVAAGPHRSPVSTFIRDPRAGGCSVGTPPDNLGFRLVRSDRWYAPMLIFLRERNMMTDV